jgi:holo-[acyl-carrier protein] synthase
LIYGIGTDIVGIKRIENSLFRFGDRFLHRILNESEVLEYAQSAQPARFVSKRFAVKEAFSKAWGTGIGVDVSWHDIAIRHDRHGKPLLHPSVAMGEKMAARNICAMHVSISDESEHAVAFVILEMS